MYDTFFVLGLINFLGRIYFLENVPKPLISTFSSKATASIIVSMIAFTDSVIWALLKFGNSFLRDYSILDRV